MVKIIGTVGCSKCETLKASIPKGSYEWVLFHDLSDEEQDDLLNRAEAVGQRNLPLVLVQETILSYKTIQDIIPQLKELLGVE